MNRKLTNKQLTFVDYLVTHPKASGTQAVLATYDTDDPVVAASIAYENLRKPQIKAYMRTIVKLSFSATLVLNFAPRF